MVSLLEAEFARVRKQNKQAQKFYAHAINASESMGHMHDAGASHECAAVFFLHSLKDSKRAARHIEEAIRCYSEWGASAVVARIERKYQELLATARAARVKTKL